MYILILFVLIGVNFTHEYPQKALDYYCPEPNICEGCPDDWNLSSISYSGTSYVDQTCDITFYWDWDYPGEGSVNPLLVFICYYSNNEICNAGQENRCGSCQNFTISGIDLTRSPYLSYSDSCGNIIEVSFPQTCEGRTVPPPVTTESYSTTTTTTTTTTVTALSTLTTPRPQVCSIIYECMVCPQTWSKRNFTVKGTPSGSGLCDIEITWKWPYAPNTGQENAALIFGCIYGANGEYCERHYVQQCASCQTASFYNLNVSLNPYIDYRDSCTNVGQISIGDDCEGVTKPTEVPPDPPGYCIDMKRCLSCPGEIDLPIFNLRGAVAYPDNCTVDITWEWPYGLGPEDNMMMKFTCFYASGAYCEDIEDVMCGSCEKATLSNIKPSEHPRIEYSDRCDNAITFPLTELCSS